jgi:hypothetical protein
MAEPAQNNPSMEGHMVEGHMKGTVGRTGRAFAALAFAGTLGFGMVQAFASGAPEAHRRTCSYPACGIACQADGALGGAARSTASTTTTVRCIYIG